MPLFEEIAAILSCCLGLLSCCLFDLLLELLFVIVFLTVPVVVDLFFQVDVENE